MSKMQDIQDWLRKYLFWCLCGLIALFSLGAWWLGVGTLNTETKTNLVKIQGEFDKATKITSKTVIGGIHPNEKVNEELQKLTLSTRETVLKTWKTLYDRQKETVFKWPAILDKAFLDWINSNPPDAEIPPNQLVEYQNKVIKELERIVTQVANAEWPDAVAAAAAAATANPGSTFPGGGRGFGTEGGGRGDVNPTVLGPGVPGESEKLLWDHANITAFKNRYYWRLRPTSAEVRLAQEDLWILEQLCQAIAQVNGQAPPYLRPIKVVNSIALEGFAIDGKDGNPKGINSNRLLRMQTATAPTGTAEAPAAEPATADAAPAETAGPTVSAPPARLGSAFQGSGSSSGGSRGGEFSTEGAGDPGSASAATAPAPGVATSANPEDELYEWRYVDQAGYPLSKAQLDGEHKADLYRMVPFKMQMHIVQSQMPKLFETLKNAPLTLEVNQVRINAERNAAGQFSGLTKTAGGDGGLATQNFNSATGQPVAGLLPGEVILEIHGTAYLAQPYDEKKLPLPDGIASPEGT